MNAQAIAAERSRRAAEVHIARENVERAERALEQRQAELARAQLAAAEFAPQSPEPPAKKRGAA